MCCCHYIDQITTGTGALHPTAVQLPLLHKHSKTEFKPLRTLLKAQAIARYRQPSKTRQRPFKAGNETFQRHNKSAHLQSSSTRPRGLQAPAQSNFSPPVSNPKSESPWSSIGIVRYGYRPREPDAAAGAVSSAIGNDWFYLMLAAP